MAELADAQDLGFCAPRVSNLLTDTQHYTRFISAAKGRILKLALLCSFLLIVGLQISESPAQSQEPLCDCADICLKDAVRCGVTGCAKEPAHGQEGGSLTVPHGAENGILIPKDTRPSKKTFLLGTAVLAGATTADAITTRQLLNRGGFEMNPIYGKRPSPAKQAGINAAFFAGSVTAFYFTEKSHNRFVRWAGRSWIGLQTAQHSYLAACNAGINVRAPVQQTCGAPIPF